MDDYYRIMGLPRIASTSEIKARYRELAKRYHPDRRGDAVTMTRLNRAYRVLSDPRQRFVYNQQLEASQTVPKVGVKPQTTVRTKATVRQQPYQHQAAAPAPPSLWPRLRLRHFTVVVSFGLLILLLSMLYSNQRQFITAGPTSPAVTQAQNATTQVRPPRTTTASPRRVSSHMTPATIAPEPPVSTPTQQNLPGSMSGAARESNNCASSSNSRDNGWKQWIHDHLAGIQNYFHKTTCSQP